MESDMYKYFKVHEDNLEKFNKAIKDYSVEVKQYDDPLKIFIEQEAEIRLNQELNWRHKTVDSNTRENLIYSITNKLNDNIGMITDNDYISDLTNEAIRLTDPDFYK